MDRLTDWGIYSYSFNSTAVDKTELCHRAKIKRDGDRTEKTLLTGDGDLFYRLSVGN